MCRQDIRKAFSCGDFVEVIGGEHQGKDGFVTEVDETHAMLYSMGSASGLEDQHAAGKEVITLTITYACC
jgi:transcription elongation factor